MIHGLKIDGEGRGNRDEGEARARLSVCLRVAAREVNEFRGLIFGGGINGAKIRTSLSVCENGVLSARCTDKQ